MTALAADFAANAIKAGTLSMMNYAEMRCRTG
jgi:hypothetical protein